MASAAVIGGNLADLLLSSPHCLPVVSPLVGKNIGYVRMPGNVGGKLIELATLQLFVKYGVQYYLEDFSSPKCVADELVIAGGGNMGTLYPLCRQQRVRALLTGKKVTVLPQSFVSEESYPYHRVFVREVGSWKFCPDAILAPDLALAFECEINAPNPQNETGLWLRSDVEGKFPDYPCNGDPAKECNSVADYLHLASRFSHIITDRLHFAICGLISNREVTLLPNRYHKNRAMYDTWLQALGCKWDYTPPLRKDAELKGAELKGDS